jgi:CheY-like chemotaxis protein
MITVESTKGEGTVFKVLMPVVASEKGPVPKTQPPHKGDGVILLVDDEEAVRCVGERLLQRMGYTVYTAQDGHDAIRVFKERGGSIDCVLLDLSMPDLDGRETFRELRKLRPDIPVILSSGYNEQQAENRFLRDSLAGFIQKPYQSTELAARIDAALNASGSAAKQMPARKGSTHEA